jgi:anhydro-N-acetylmuramic acid kinase
MDGIDAALVDLPSHQLIYGITKPYSDEVHTALSDLLVEQQISLAKLYQLNTLIGRDFASATQQLLAESNYCAADIKAIGSHGQTICHDASAIIPYTAQLGCGHTISSLTGIDVVADFRTRDLVNGGQGAPFAPLYHQELFARTDESVALVNIGGIANTTFLTPGQATRGWDVGPGNCLMDAWIYLHQEKHYDEGGHWAEQGVVSESLLTSFLADPFFSLPAPKSIGKEYFSLAWLEEYHKNEYKPVDIQATLLALTASCIADSFLKANQATNKLYLCGGGTHNVQLLQALRQRLPGIIVGSISDLGLDPDYLEAMMFAWLASQSINMISVDLSQITGSKKPAILGALYPIKK